MVDANQEHNNYYQQTNILGSGYNQRTDIISCGDVLPFQDNSIDFVFSSHVLEHFYDPIKALKEWYRVIKKDGYIAMIVPHKERTFDKDRDRTTLNELIERHNKVKNYKYNVDERGMHFSVWITEDILELCKYLNMNVIEYLDVDDAVGNGFAIIIKKINHILIIKSYFIIFNSNNTRLFIQKYNKVYIYQKILIVSYIIKK
ncbi:methyltransferase domain-containing protein [Brachyspira hyodysenteriae]|uniref:methyltransferase domain-containing protein n=2 Tax=Brachyspira hyodysenteriae TaxID=159 RepID=UPI003BF56FC3